MHSYVATYLIYVAIVANNGKTLILENLSKYVASWWLENFNFNKLDHPHWQFQEKILNAKKVVKFVIIFS